MEKKRSYQSYSDHAILNMSSEFIDGDQQASKTSSLGPVPPVRSRSSRGSPAQVDPAILTTKDSSTSNTWVRKVPPVIGMRERGADGSSSSAEGPETGSDHMARSASPVDSQTTRTRTISANSNGNGIISPSSDATGSIELETPPPSPKPNNWSPAPAASVRLGAHGHKEGRKMTTSVVQEVTAGNNANAISPAPGTKTSSPINSSTDSASSTSQSLPKIIPNQSMPLLSTLFEQTHSLLDRKEEDWAIANYDQLRHVISQLFNSVPLIRQMLALVKRIAPIFIERHQEREATNRYKEAMYLAEKIGGDAAAEQIELNLLVADSYILRSELALDDRELAVNIAAYSNEALWLCHTYKLHSRLEDCKSKIDLAEALFCAIFLVNTNIVLRLTQILSRKPQEFARVFKVVERTLHQLFKHQSWLMIRKLYQSGILQACTQASQKLNDDSYLLQMLYIQTQVNLTLLKPSEVGKIPESSSSPTRSRSISSSTPDSPRNSASSLAGFSGWLPTDVPSNWSEFRQQLESMRNDINVSELAQNLLQPEYVQTVQVSINQKLTNLIKMVFDYCVEMVGDPPCPFSVFALGSLSRAEAAPYSDLEYGFMIGEESRRESGYWKDLWTIFEFTFICFGERVGLHTDDQGSPKTPTFRGTPTQLMELFINPLDAHDISTAFSMLRPHFISSYPSKTGRELHDAYLSQVNRHLQSIASDGFHQYTRIGSLFLEDHLSQLSKWMPRESDACVELKTNYIQPLVFTITDTALSNGSYVGCTNAGVCQLVDGLGDGRNSHLGFTAEFSRSIKTLFLACYGLKVLAQLHYHEQFEGDKVSITPPPQTLNASSSSSSSSSSSLPPNTTGALYYLTREQVYWLRMAQAVVLKPLYSVLPHILNYINTNPFVSSMPTVNQSHLEPFSGIPKNWGRIDPILDAAEQLVDPKFDPYNSSRPTALEDTKDLIRSLIATLIFRDAAISRYRHYYKQLASDFKLLYRAAVTSHAGTQGVRVQMLSYVFDSYASPDGTRPLIERLKAHFRDHISSIEPAQLQKLLSSWDPKLGVIGSTPVVLKVTQPVGWPSQSRLKPVGNEPLFSTMKPATIGKFEGQLGYELVVSLIHFALIGYGAPLIDVRSITTSAAKEVPAVFVEQVPGDPLPIVLATDPLKFKQLDSKSFTELVLVNIVLMCDARAADFVFEPLSEDLRGGYRLSRASFGSAEPSPEPILISKEKVSLKVCNILFCMSSMLQTVHPYAVEEFLGLTPTHLMTRLVQDIETLNKEWKTKLDAASVASFNRYVQPAPLPSATSLINIPHFVLGVFFDRIVKLQKVLSQTPRATHLDLLRAVDPIVGQIYADVLSQSSGLPPSSILAMATASAVAPSTTILDRTPLIQASGSTSNANANETIDRLTRLESKTEFSLSSIFGVASTSPKLFTRIEKLRKSSYAILPSSLPSTEPIFEKSDHISHMDELKSQLMNMPANSVSFPREDMLKNNSMKEKLLCSVDFAKIDVKKQRQTLLSLFDTVKFTSQLRIRHCPELDHQRLSRLVNGESVKQLTLLDLRGMTGIKHPTLALIASIENLEYLNLSQTDIKSVSIEKWTKREPFVLDKVVWIGLARCSGLQHVILRAPNLRHLDITSNTSMTEFKVLSTHKVSLIGSLSQQMGYNRVISEIPSVSWFYSPDSVPISLEKIFYDVASGRDHRLLIHIPLNESTARLMAEVIRHAPTLEIVDLSNSIMAEDVIDAVVASAISNPSIRSLDLTGCGAKPSKVQSFSQQFSARSDLKSKF
jgi:hypothetical protein